MLRNDPDIGEDRHEVGIADPTRHDVLMHMLGDTGAGGRSQVDTDVEALRLECADQKVTAQNRESVQFGSFGGFVITSYSIHYTKLYDSTSISCTLSVSITSSAA